ncbi:Two component transcriptional regulator, LuxR family [Nitrolancea hollandica Lb]|uniref:Two component transcriptional regulator, LuxR family n=2 Tax=Nitrolancea hollandica TaxID=1206749 RepID=I4EIC5_9BACT|nr:Two component transcriptional regulator, LuxR family [Nitrolancea hollandica Lb]
MRVLIADGHAIFRRGLADILNVHGLTVVGEARNGREAVRLARQLQPDIVLMDLTMPRLGGLTATRWIKEEMAEVKVVILTASEADDDLLAALKSGAQGYLLKDIEAKELVALLERVQGGERVVTPRLTSMLVAAIIRSGSDLQPPEPAMLTAREREVLELLVRGVTSNHELAERLRISENTVRYHVRNVLQKLHLQNRTQAVAYALRNGLVNPPDSTD